MTHSLTVACTTLLALTLIACESVPKVESRLQALQFHPNMYVVQAGDTLDTIAFRYKLSTAELSSLNPGAQKPLRAGKRLNVRLGTQLSDAIRAGASWRPAGQPDIVAANVPKLQPATVDVNTRAEQPIVVSPTTRHSGDLTRQSIAERSTDQSNQIVVVASGISVPQGAQPHEEVIRDELDYEPVSHAEGAINQELQGYIGHWVWPTTGEVARGFLPGKIGGQGVDIAGVPGQDVRAALDGTVVYSGRDLSGEGNLIIVRHEDNLMTTYSHTDNLFVAEDDAVKAGDPIASLGWNNDRESVLRFEVRRDGNPLNPMDFLPGS
ncbi:MAG: peptidoglycan DD-metalloendopeptidase family protein [Granulosicoccus sp.]